MSLVPASATVIDVGADRGLLSLSLSERGHKVYAVENKKGPFSILTSHIKEMHSDVCAIFADGLDVLPEDVNCVCILGMGGETMKQILWKAKEKLRGIHTLILEPQSAFSDVFRLMKELGYKMDYGEYVFEKRYYPLVRYVKGIETETYTDSESSFGKYMMSHKDPLLCEYIVSELRRYEKVGDEGRKRNETEIRTLEKAYHEITGKEYHHE